jgi:hypothetical protein
MLASAGFCQDQPYLQLSVRENFLTQKIDFLDGSKVLDKSEVLSLMTLTDPETMEIYRRSMSNQKLSNALGVASLATTVGSFVYIITPQKQTSTGTNLFLPFLITDLSLSILSGVFKRNARNLAREAVDSYNFGRAQSPVYFEENRVNRPIFSHVIRF